MLLQRLRPMASLGMLPIPVFAAVVTSSSGHDAMLCASGHITTGFQLAALSTLVLRSTAEDDCFAHARE